MTAGAKAAPRSAWLFLAGVLIAFVCSMCGVGGGLFAVPLLHFGYRLELRRAIATSLALVLATVTAATLTEALHEESALDYRLLGFLVVGAVVGAQAGFWVAHRIDPRALRGAFVVALMVAGGRILLEGTPTEAEAVTAVGDGLPWLRALAIGFGGGVVSPVLGVGGGLLFVPALYLGMPALGFAGARAMSLATSIAAASRGLWLYARSGEVSRAPALWLAGGAATGAVAGVRTVHLPGFVEVARLGLGTILLYVAGRFAWEIVRDRGRRGAQA